MPTGAPYMFEWWHLWRWSRNIYLYMCTRLQGSRMWRL